MNQQTDASAPTVDPMEQFFTSDTANAGAKIFLRTPQGELTQHWLRLRGVDSDEFRVAQAKLNRTAVRIAAIEDEKTRELASLAAQREMIASLVMGWSFPVECTQEAVVAFLRKAPQFEDQIDRTVSNRTLFFALASRNSDASPTTSSDSI